MSFNTSTITYEQWSIINRTLAGASLEIKDVRVIINGRKETPIESRNRRLVAIKAATQVLADIYDNAE